MINPKSKMLVLLFAITNFAFAQMPQTNDCFPGTVGNKWEYTYVTKQVGYVSHFSSTESGFIEYRVLSKSEKPNGFIFWEIRQRKNATRDTYGIPLQSVKDSTTITIIESVSLNHELYSSTATDPLTLFPFKAGSPDTSKFFRYKENPTGLDIFLRIIFPDPSNPTLSKYNYEFKIRKEVGILMLVFGRSYVSGMESSEYYLTKFNNQTISGLEPIESIHTGYSLSQNYPNPFNPETTISYSIPKSEHVTLKVFDLLGQEVATLVDEYKSAGTYNVVFSVKTRHGASLQSGIYFYRLQCGSYNETKKLILMK